MSGDASCAREFCVQRVLHSLGPSSQLSILAMDQALTLKLPSQTHLRAFVPPPASYSVTQDESLCAATMPGNGQGPTRPAAAQSPLGCLGTSEQWGPGAPSSAEPGLCASA